MSDAAQLRATHGTWGEDPDFPVEDWQHGVANDETRLGYWEWVEARIDERDEDDDEPWTETERAAYNGLSSVDYHNPL